MTKATKIMQLLGLAVVYVGAQSALTIITFFVLLKMIGL